MQKMWAPWQNGPDCFTIASTKDGLSQLTQLNWSCPGMSHIVWHPYLPTLAVALRTDPSAREGCPLPPAQNLRNEAGWRIVILSLSVLAAIVNLQVHERSVGQRWRRSCLACPSGNASHANAASAGINDEWTSSPNGTMVSMLMHLKWDFWSRQLKSDQEQASCCDEDFGGSPVKST